MAIADLLPLSLAFGIIACLYSSVGFGGGSSYLALLALTSLNWLQIPTIALSANLLVAGSTLLHLRQRRLVNLRLLLPFLLFSIPATYLGALVGSGERTWRIILGCSLLLAGLIMAPQSLLWMKVRVAGETRYPPIPLAMAVGGGAGFLAGMVGIGGGIFLAPILYLCGWGKTGEVAATATLFILINSSIGLIGRLLRGTAGGLLDYLPLYLAVLVGAQIGNIFSRQRHSAHWIRLVTALLIIFVALRLLLFAQTDLLCLFAAKHCVLGIASASMRSGRLASCVRCSCRREFDMIG